MPKRKASEAPTPVQEKPVLELKKTGNEIDEIFSSKKKKKPKQERADKQIGGASEKKKPKQERADKQMEDGIAKSKNAKKKNRKFHEKDVLANPSSQPRNRTQDGLSIYSEYELGISRSDAGGTPLCPFDCSCCF